MILNNVADLLRKEEKFLIVSHKDPDGDAIGSTLALSETLKLSGKEVVAFNNGPIPHTFSHLRGANRIVDDISPDLHFDATVVLDCGNLERVGDISFPISKFRPLINIDHHESNSLFGDLNLVDIKSSSVGEIIYRLIKSAELPLNENIAEYIFVAIQTDTGSFKYDNTTAAAFTIAGEMLGLGVRPWKISRNIMDGSSLKRIKLLGLSLETMELHHSGMLALITVTRDMQLKTMAQDFDTEGFIDYPRFIEGVEIGALIKETGENKYKISLRSNEWVNVSDLARSFNGGGHPRAASFTIEGSLEFVKERFINRAVKFLDMK